MQDQTDLIAIRKNLTDWLAAFNAKDLDQLFTLYDPESVYANATAPLMEGIDQIKPWYAGAFEQIEGTLLYKEEKAFIEGGLGILIGSYYFKPPEGEAPEMTGRVALLYRRNAHGEWKLLFDMDNTPPDVTPQTFA